MILYSSVVVLSKVVEPTTSHLGELGSNFIVEETEVRGETNLNLNSRKANSLLELAPNWALSEAILDSITEPLSPEIWGARAHIQHR